MTESTLQTVITLIRKTTGLPPSTDISSDTPILSTGLCLDSITILELLLAMEQHFGIELDAGELSKTKALASVGTLVAFVETKRQRLSA